MPLPTDLPPLGPVDCRQHSIALDAGMNLGKIEAVREGKGGLVNLGPADDYCLLRAI